MIRNVIIMASSGLVLYSKEFNNSVAQPRLIGSLLTAMIEFGHQTTGMSVAFIDLSNISIAIANNESSKIFCCLFYDRTDGKLFGKLICSEILNAFIQDYSSGFTQLGFNLKDYKGFHKRMLTVIYYAVRPIITHLEGVEGIRKAVLARHMEIIDSQQDQEINEFAILADVPALLNLANELILHDDDQVQSVTIDGDDEDQVIIWKIQNECYLICVIDQSVDPKLYTTEVDDALDMIEQIGILHEDYKLTLK